MLQDLQAFEPLTPPQAWPDAEVERLFRLRLVEGWDWPEIARELGRTASGVKSKFKYELHRRQCRAVEPLEVREAVPADVLARQARKLTAWYRSQAAAFCGDPPIGFSALDERRAA